MTLRRVLLAAAGVVVILAVAWFFFLREPARPPVQATAAKPQGAVLLIPGYGGGTAQIAGLETALRSAGYRTQVIDVGDGQGDLREYAGLVTEASRRLAVGGQPAPDLIGYSAGGLTARIAATDEPSLFNRVITLAAPNNGTNTAELGATFGECPVACQQMRPDSELLSTLPEPAQPLSWLAIWSESDEAIRPADSSVLPDINTYRVQDACDVEIGHAALPSHPQTIAVIEAFLASSETPQHCVAPDTVPRG